MAKRHERSLARRMALQALYASDVLRDASASAPDAPDETIDSLDAFLEQGAELPDLGPLPDYAIELLEGVREHADEIDQALAQASQNWSVDRMPMVDHAILSLAAFEIIHVDEVPVAVCINEAVELAREFGGEDNSARFANGILGQIARTYCGEASVPAADDGAAEDGPSPNEDTCDSAEE